MGRASSLAVSRLLRRPVEDPGGEKLGHVDDLVVDLQAGRIEFVRLRVHDPEGQARRFVLVPWSQLSAAPGADRPLVLPVSYRVLRSLSRTDDDPERGPVGSARGR